jgi:hypothetical protein
MDTQKRRSEHASPNVVVLVVRYFVVFLSTLYCITPKMERQHLRPISSILTRNPFIPAKFLEFFLRNNFFPFEKNSGQTNSNAPEHIHKSNQTFFMPTKGDAFHVF